MSSQKFLHDRERGHVGVQIVKERLEKQGTKVTAVPDDQFDDYDMRSVQLRMNLRSWRKSFLSSSKLYVTRASLSREEIGKPLKMNLWYTRRDSNAGPSAPEADALSS